VCLGGFGVATGQQNSQATHKQTLLTWLVQSTAWPLQTATEKRFHDMLT
jgi:hypothetical protein